MDILSLVIFLAVIVLAFVRKCNVGIVALGVGVIAVRVLGLTDKALISGVSASMFVTLVGITLLFALINSTGALDLMARKIISLAGHRLWLLPIAVFIAGFIISAVGPGAVPALAIIPALAVSIAIPVGFNPVMLSVIGCAGLIAGRMSPITPEAAIITAAAESAGLENVMPTILVCLTIVCIIYSVIAFFLFKGHKVKATDAMDALKTDEKFTKEQIISLLSIVAMLVLIIFFDVNIGLSAFIVAMVLILFRVGDEAQAIKSIPWGTITMVLGVGALLGIVQQCGGFDLLSDAMASIMTKSTATPIMGLSAGLLSLVSSALGVVYPTMMPMCAEIAAQVGGVNPVALMAAVGAGGSLAGLSPLSTGGALTMAALGTQTKMSETEENKVFVQLFLQAGLALVIIMVVGFLIFNPIANAMMG